MLLVASTMLRCSTVIILIYLYLVGCEDNLDPANCHAFGSDKEFLHLLTIAMPGRDLMVVVMV